MEPIYRLFNGAFIDLDKLVSITTNEDFDSVFVIVLDFLQRDHPLEVTISLDTYDKNYARELRDDIVSAWKKYKSRDCGISCRVSSKKK